MFWSSAPPPKLDEGSTILEVAVIIDLALGHGRAKFRFGNAIVSVKSYWAVLICDAPSMLQLAVAPHASLGPFHRLHIKHVGNSQPEEFVHALVERR